MQSIGAHMVLICASRKYRHHSGDRHYSAYCRFVLVVPSCTKRFHRHCYSGQPALQVDLYRTSSKIAVCTKGAGDLPRATRFNVRKRNSSRGRVCDQAVYFSDARFFCFDEIFSHDDFRETRPNSLSVLPQLSRWAPTRYGRTPPPRVDTERSRSRLTLSLRLRLRFKIKVKAKAKFKAKIKVQG